jgi:hypothetical protein
MSVDQYLEHLIDTAKLHAAGDTSIAIQPSELVTLKTLIASERLRRQQTFATTKNGNPA